ncbi:nuclear transport factor 2 family protein [Hoeflea sp.]|uniref:nuclear transport factor 2 family protein n=1 Tax=Hoeflea sp. TaxID=1940281 RepID=UPI003B01A026
MAELHPNVALLSRFDPRNLASATELFSQDAVFHYFNPKLPDVQGDYVGLSGIQKFFETIAARTDGTFKVEPISMTPVGDELVVMHTRNTMTLEDQAFAIDVVLVWRIVDGRISEVWDIPSVYTEAADG